MSWTNIFCPTIFIFVSIMVANLCICVLSCPDICGETVVPYPFGIGGQCGIKSLQLHCNSNTSQLQLWVGYFNFSVLSLSPQTVVINPLRSYKCGSPNFLFFPFSGYDVPGSNYVISQRNVVMMYGCERKNCTCDIHSEFEAALALERPYDCPSDFCCGILHFQSLKSLMNSWNCSSFVSWAVNVDHVKLTSPLRIQIQFGLELEAWVPGRCTCVYNARCIERPNGHTCECLDGYVGDGFASGIGCYRNGTSCKSLAGCTRNIILITAGGVAGVCVLVGIAATVIMRRRHYQAGDSQNRKDIKQIEGILCNRRVTKVFAYKELERATRDFSDQQRLGNGAFGTVYAGKLSDGTAIAVKRINYRYMQGIQQVVNEVKVLAAVDHPNLVRLLGCCLEYGDPLLVYEYVPNGTLAEHLQGQRQTRLTWLRRVNIALETAQALSYLHSLSPPIYHRDVKSSNILLDYDYRSKIADFGLSRLVLTDNSHISTVPQGTPGYLDPDYHQNFHLSEKSDVYSFGVVLVELITALKAVDFSRSKSEINLANLALTRIANGTLDDVIDESLGAKEEPTVRAMIQVVAEVAFRCLSHDKDARPTIREVAEELDYVRNLVMENSVPKQSMEKARITHWSLRRDGFTKVRSGSCSSNDEVWGSRQSSITNG